MKNIFYSERKYKILLGLILSMLFVGVFPIGKIISGEVVFIAFWHENNVSAVFTFVFALYSLNVFFVRYIIFENNLIVSHFYLYSRAYSISDINGVELVKTYFPYFNISISSGKNISTNPIGNKHQFIEILKSQRKQDSADWYYREVERKFFG